ncbi:DNA translocase FtsK [Streptococcus sp. S784/96/1]|uniref:DNA translocase FtsK n=1 Tax=Streptococcus sp. S784/96/1 TaxID=2653499 RepID=UPI001387252D|nr:DNA translocase FtsK [Streptococcus sp. S784/96/1]
MSNTRKNSTKRSTKRQTKADYEKSQATQRLITAVIVVLFSIFAVFRIGIFGVTLYNIARFLVGSLAYLVLFCTMIYLTGFKFFRKVEGLVSGFVILMIGLLMEWHAWLFTMKAFAGKDIFKTTIALLVRDLSSFEVKNFVGGGMLGAILYAPVSFLVTNIGTFMIGTLFILLGLFLMSPWDVHDLSQFSAQAFDKWQSKAELRRQERFIRQEEKRLQQEAAAQEQARLEEEASLAELAYDEETGEIFETENIPVNQVEVENDFEPEIVGYQLDDEVYDVDSLLEVQPQEPLPSPTKEDDDDPVTVDFSPKKAILLYKLPSIDLFAPDKPKNQSKEKYIVRQNIKTLEETFRSFGIEVKVERAEIGPSVTRYELKPAVGVRVNRISNLADDLALALAAKDVRIEAPIPGKSLVGIEVPNSEIATVSFRELWEQSDTKPENLLEIPLGKAVNGTAKSFDLAKMPHLLVAGSTGSGKSVAVNGIISSILMKARPDEVKFMMIDPKMVELSVYNDIPHLLIPVVTNPRKASKALQKVVQEMENRYELFSHIGVRNIAGYNAKVAEHSATSQEKQVPLPLIVVIVDELADLMMVASKEVEDAIIRLGQKARAAGIHMILATQRPSVDVISGLIKANVPSRVAFAVASGTDSRTILGENGAEKLLGRGDMLFHPIGESAPIRLQGSFISDDDVERIVNFVKNQAEADYDESFDPGEVSEADGGFDGESGASEGDPLFAEAKAMVIETQKASASMLQRRLQVGFNRATRLMEELEEAGVIGPAEGTKPRKVLEQ